MTYKDSKHSALRNTTMVVFIKVAMPVKLIWNSSAEMMDEQSWHSGAVMWWVVGPGQHN